MMPTVTFSFLLGYGFEMNVNHMLRRVYLWEASRPLNSVTDFQKHLTMSFKLNNNVPQVICTVWHVKIAWSTQFSKELRGMIASQSAHSSN